MPGVRYGPDITDDAAQMLSDILLFKEQTKAGKVERDVRRRYNRAAKMAKQLFGLTDKDIEKGRYKDLKILAEYGEGARKVGSKRGFYKRGKMARNKRTGKLMKRSIMEEGRRQTLFDEKPKGRTILSRSEATNKEIIREANRRIAVRNPRTGKQKRDKRGRLVYRKPTKKEVEDRINLATASRDSGGLSYLGRTNPKRLRDAMSRFDRRMKRNKQGVVSDRGTQRIKIRPYMKGGKADIARLKISKGKEIARGRLTALPQKPPKAKSATRAKAANRARKATVKKAGRKTNVRRGRKK
jgi:hypothetical protein